MKKGIELSIAGTMMLVLVAACGTPGVHPEPTATGMNQVNMPNPASIHCEQNGNKLEIRTAADGSQSGVCIFPDGSICDEWAYFRGECPPAPPASPTPIESIEVTIEATMDSVDSGSGGYMPPGTSEEISDWWGVIRSTDPGAQYDDYFERQDLGGAIYFGIDSLVPEVQAKIESLRDSGKIVHLYGTLFSNVIDYNGSQILVDRLEIEE